MSSHDKLSLFLREERASFEQEQGEIDWFYQVQYWRDTTLYYKYKNTKK